MKAMKGMSMNRMIGSLKRKPRDGPSEAVGAGSTSDAQFDTPEANAARNVRLFCESGGPNGSGDEVLYLPAIVESAESSPGAAKEAAIAIRKFLGKENFAKPYVQYNAIMLIRILADNPGKTFTRNVDAKFVETVKELLRVGRDPSVKQILMETLDTFQREKQDDESLAKLNEMWKKEHERMVKIHGPQGPRAGTSQQYDTHSQNYFARNHHTKRLPQPQELASRIEEARTSAKLLSQLTLSTPPSEVLSSDLIKEFADRCQSASRSIQAYMIAENPSPDNDTMETLIETNEQLGKSMSQHQRAVLNARKAAGLGNGTPEPPAGRDSAFAPPPSRTESGFAAPPGPPPTQVSKDTPPPAIAAPVPRRTIFSKKGPQVPPPGDYAPHLSDDDENPFNDPQPASSIAPRDHASDMRPPFSEDRPNEATGQFHDQLGVEPYHPGFRETQSYVGRQDSSLGKITMHAAGEPVKEEEEGQNGGYGANAGTRAPVYRF